MDLRSAGMAEGGGGAAEDPAECEGGEWETGGVAVGGYSS